MSISTKKKLGRKPSPTMIPVAAASVVMSVAGMVFAGATPPYTTSFEASPPDSAGQTYTTGNLVGQNNWTFEDGEVVAKGSGTASVVSGASPITASGSQAVELQTTGFGGDQTSGSAFSDFYNASLADHTGTTAGTAGAPGTTAGTPLNPSLVGGTVNISFGMNHNTGLSGDGAGLDIFDGSDNLIASLFAVTNASTGSHDLEVYNDSSGPTVVTGAAGAGRTDSVYATYRISLNFNTHTFTVFVDGNTASATYSFDPTQTTIGGIAFAMDDVATDGTSQSAYFDNLSVVPEPASLAMVGLGGLLLLVKRPKRDTSGIVEQA